MAEATATGTRLDEGFVREFAERWHAAWNSRDPRQVAALCTDDVVLVDAADPAPKRGHGAMAAVVDMLARAFPDYRFAATEPPLVASDRPKAIMPWRFEGTFAGDLTPPGFAPTGERIEFHGDDHWEFRGDRVARCEILYDVNAIALAIGATPQPGSVGERIGVLLQRLEARRRRGRRRTPAS